ncbi:MAG: hypothetical protein TE42_07795 [Candidatus Synechococcus spongiarum SP3]|uniref:Uncharacterized protein n=1 Tax=Candidatus Synechococcus spongiarum SP3 TaxID=1604020 RepID=A0A0G2IVV6_9SYNE|nr:MAG: hypothetical protein TE42_07795 [Candidatus Synechococcus spongiarum SP3]
MGLAWEGLILAAMPPLLLSALVTGGITIVTAALGAIWLEIKASRRELREDMKEMRDDMREMRAEYRSGIQALGEKVDRLVASLLTTKHS